MSIADLVIPKPAVDAREMAERVVRIADALAEQEVKPTVLACQFTYLWGQPLDAVGFTPSTRDGVDVQVTADEQDRLITAWGLVVADDAESDTTNRYASGVIFGVPVLVYAGRPAEVSA